MVAGKSPEWLPPSFTEKLKYKNGRKIKYYLDVATGKKYHSKKDLLCAIEDNGKLVTPQKENVVDNGLSDNKSDVMSVRTNDTPAWFPDGWRVEEKTRQTGSSQGSVYKVYIETSSGRKFYSKASVTRYLGGLNHTNAATVQNKIDNVDEPTVDMSLQFGSLINTGGNDDMDKFNVNEPTVEMPPQLVSMTNTDDINNVVKPNVDEPAIDMSPQLVSMTNNDDINNVVKPNVDEPSIDISPELASMTNTGRINKRKRKDSGFVTVSIDCTTDNDLPPGWIKEIKTSKCGNKTRKDPYYTDPVSGYVFRSKLDALRFLKTKDIGSCACRPLKRELDNMKLIEDEILSSNPANEKLPIHKKQYLLGGESNGGEESSGTKGLLPEAQAKISKQKQENPESDSVKITSVIEEDISRDSSEKNAQMTNNLEPENVSKEDTRLAVDVAIVSPVTEPLTKQHLSENGNITKVNSRKSKKRGDSSLPSRTSKRLAGSQPLMASNSDFNERSLRAALRKSSGSEVNKSPSSALNASISIPLPSDGRGSLPGSRPVMSSNSDFNERSLKTAPRKSFVSEVDKSPSFALNASINIPLPSDIEPRKEATEQEFTVEETLKYTLEEIQKLFNEVEDPPTEGPAIPEELSGGKVEKSKLSEETPIFYDFGESWSDPLKFAVKTLMGDFPSCLNEQQTGTQAGGCLQQPQPEAPNIFQNAFASRSESSRQHGAVDQLPPISSSFSTLENIGFPSFGGFNCQSSAEVGKKDSQTKFNP